MGLKRDVMQWFASAHFRKKQDFICIDQPKVIDEWRHTMTIRGILLAESVDMADWMVSYRVERVSRPWLLDVTSTPSHSGVMVVFDRPLTPSVPLTDRQRVVVLDTIQDPGNLGTIIRTMGAMGLTTLCLTRRCVDVFHPKCVRAAVGALVRVDVWSDEDWRDWFMDTSLPVWGLDPRGEVSLPHVASPDSYILVAGSEGQGIQSDVILAKQMTRVSIPMSPDVESLNVAIGFAMAAYHFSHRP